MKLSSRSKAFLPALIVAVIAAVFVLRFGAIVVILTIVPSLVAMFVDHSQNRTTFKVIAACNLSAALYFIVPIVNFSLNKQYTEAAQLMEDPKVWAYIYLSAGAGWGMLFLAKFLSRIITLMHYDYSISVLDKKQQLLVKEWGEDITHPATIKSQRNY